ncbi:MAG: 3-hydroxybutyryl-CoA dehydrogenase [Alphaproteobacteria bacterium]
MSATVNRLGVVGAGQMGNGIAHVAAIAGISVTVVDAQPAALERATKIIEQNMARQVKRGLLDEAGKVEATARIALSGDLASLSDCDMVIEAVTEDEKVKVATYKQLCPVLKPEAIVCSNTSSISITRLAAATDRPARFMGMHFMNPVPVMKLVELIRGLATDDATFATVTELAKRMGKIGTVSEDFPAFIVNRVLLPMINEAVYVLYEGVGTVDSIDTSMKLGANHPMGPLELADFIGLDTCLSIMQVLYDGLADSKYRPCPLLVKYVEAGWLGRKVGRGFYDYSGETPVPTR